METEKRSPAASIQALALMTSLMVLAIGPSGVSGQEANGVRPLLAVSLNELRAMLPSDARVLDDATSIESFLDELDGSPPDWVTVYGRGHHDSGYDERLFALNRERDRLRKSKLALQRPVTFVWSGELSQYDAQFEWFRVAVGPKYYQTRWGMVRFKPEEVPPNLVAVPTGRRIDYRMAP